MQVCHIEEAVMLFMFGFLWFCERKAMNIDEQYIPSDCLCTLKVCDLQNLRSEFLCWSRLLSTV